MADERILIYSAGASIDKTYSITAETYHPTHVMVIAEEMNTVKVSAEKKREYEKIQKAIQNLKEIVEREGRRTFDIIEIRELDQLIIQEKIIELSKKYPNAHFIFNITGGTALFSTSLLLIGIMIGADICITRTSNDPPIKLELPSISLQELKDKPQLLKIIRILAESYPDPLSNGVIMNKQGIKRVNTEGHASKYFKSGDKANQSKRMEQLISYNLVKETETVKKEKYYTLTYAGRLMSRFIL